MATAKCQSRAQAERSPGAARLRSDLEFQPRARTDPVAVPWTPRRVDQRGRKGGYRTALRRLGNRIEISSAARRPLPWDGAGRGGDSEREGVR
jgi:hypothetical protein